MLPMVHERGSKVRTKYVSAAPPADADVTPVAPMNKPNTSVTAFRQKQDCISDDRCSGVPSVKVVRGFLDAVDHFRLGLALRYVCPPTQMYQRHVVISMPCKVKVDCFF